MPKLHIILVLVSTSTLAACASPLTAIFERSVQTEHVGSSQIMSMTGERRIVVSAVNPVFPEGAPIICAESMPDAARSVDASSSATIKVPIAGAAVDQTASDSFKTALVQTFQRTETADVVRQLGWQNCLAYMNGTISREQYGLNLTSIIDGAFKALKPATPPSKSPPSADSKAEAPKSKGEPPQQLQPL